MATDYISKYAKGNSMKAFQAGGAAPADQGQQPAEGQAPAGQPQGGEDPMKLAQAYLQAKQAGDQQGMCDAAQQLMEMFIQEASKQQGAQGVPARLYGGSVDELRFDKNGNLIK